MTLAKGHTVVKARNGTQASLASEPLSFCAWLTSLGNTVAFNLINNSLKDSMFSSPHSLMNDKAEAHKGEWLSKVIQQVEASLRDDWVIPGETGTQLQVSAEFLPTSPSLLPQEMPYAHDWGEGGPATYLPD
jgi:hypothetical protein